jgi:hypothetical protein
MALLVVLHNCGVVTEAMLLMRQFNWYCTDVSSTSTSVLLMYTLVVVTR